MQNLLNFTEPDKPVNHFEAKKQRRIKRHKELADKNESAANSRYTQASIMIHAMAGTPILIGHHSEKSHRRAIEKVDDDLRKSYEHYEKSEYHLKKAEIIENSYTIYSDDPEAITKLEQKLKLMKEDHQRMILVNKQFKKSKDIFLCSELTEQEKIKLSNEMKRFDWVKQPFPSFSLSNSNAEIRRLENRIKELKQIRETELSGWEFSDGTVVFDKEYNRIKIIHDTKPDSEVINKLKRSGWHWSRHNQAWQRQITPNAIRSAKELTE
jgi:hypothetical protein